MRRSLIHTPLATILAVLCAASARGGFVDWSYAWNRSAFDVVANGGTRDGAVNLILPGGGFHSPPVAPVTLRAFTALANGDDTYHDVAYSLTFTLKGSGSSQSHKLTVHGELNGTVASDGVHLSNTFTDGSRVQTFDFLGRDFTVTFGYSATGLSPRTWLGEITGAVKVGLAPSGEVGPAVPAPSGEVGPAAPPPAAAPEPATIILACLALARHGAAGPAVAAQLNASSRRRSGRWPSCWSAAC